MREELFIEKLEDHRDEFYAYVYRQLWNKSLIDDVFSQAMLTAWEKRSHFKEGSNFRAWMYKILTFKCFSLNKKEHKNIIHLEDLGEKVEFEASDGPTQHQDIEQWLQDCDEQIPRALDQLNEKERACFLLRAMEDLSYKEISEATDFPIGTVMTHLHRARKKLQHNLSSYARQEGWSETSKTSDKRQKSPNKSAASQNSQTAQTNNKERS